YQIKIYDNVIDIKPVLEAIERNQCAAVASDMSRIQQNIEDPNVKRAFNNIITSLSRLLNNLVKGTLRKVLFLGENDVDINKNYKNCTTICYSIHIRRWIEVALNTFDALNFSEGEKKITLIRRVVDILDGYGEPIPLDDNDRNKKGQERNGKEKAGTIMGRADKLRKTIEKNC
ncbi:hypothetical protein RFI_25290, partial [Reticulomyxa filosa]